MQYSQELLKAFQTQYARSFGAEIDLQVAEAELSKLAHITKTILSHALDEDKNQSTKQYQNLPLFAMCGA